MGLDHLLLISDSEEVLIHLVFTTKGSFFGKALHCRFCMSYPVRAVCVSENIVLVGRASSVAVFDTFGRNHTVINFEQNCGNPIVAIKELSPGLYILFFGRSFKILRREISERPLNISDDIKLEEFCEVFCKHWIIDVCGAPSVEYDHPNFIFLLLSQNLVIKFDLIKKQCVVVWQCANPCILYSGLLISSKNNFISVLAGTVFNSILFWTFSAELPFTCNVLPHEAELVGHDGVIFSMDYSEEYRKLVSGSDDRSVRIWDMTSLDMTSCGATETSKTIKSSVFFFCHGARVQRVKFLRNRVISVGEDCLVCVLSFDAVLATISAHRGINIFGLAVSTKRDFFITGGEDGAVLKWNHESLEIKGMNVIKSMDMQVEIRLVKFLSKDLLLLLTAKGELVIEKNLCNEAAQEREELKTFPVLEKYAVWSVNFMAELVVFGSLFGDVIGYNLKSKCTSYLKVSTNSARINNVFFVDKTSFICSAANRLILVKILKNPQTSFAEICSFNWPITNNNWPTCGCFLSANQKIACGDRNGTVWIYASSDTDSSTNGRKACQVLVRCHSKVGVTDLIFHNLKMFTSGRDGKINVYSDDDDNGSLQLCISISLPGSIFWITKLFFYNEQLLAFCFKSDSLVLFDVQNSRVLSSHPCGGGHRSFDLLVHENHFYFAFLKKCTLSIVEGSISAGTPYDVILPSLHGTKVHCMESVEFNGSFYVFTGSEDCSVRVSIVDHRNKFVTPIASINLSPCAVRLITFHKVSEIVYLLFVAGSRSFKAVYEIRFNVENKLTVDFKKIAHETTVMKKFLDDCKFLSGDVTKIGQEILLVLGSSASYVSFYVINYLSIINGSLKLSECFCGSEIIHTKNSQLTSINAVKFFSRTSDCGDLCFLVGDNYGGATLLKRNCSQGKLEKLYHLDLSSDLGRITSIDIQDDVILLGGDSGSVTLAKLINQRQLSKIDFINCIHCSQITSSKFLLKVPGDILRFVTVSIDQRLKVWEQHVVTRLCKPNSKIDTDSVGFTNISNFDCKMEGSSQLKWAKVSDKAVGIEDVSCCSSPNGKVLFVAGHGVGIVVLHLG